MKKKPSTRLNSPASFVSQPPYFMYAYEPKNKVPARLRRARKKKRERKKTKRGKN
jgi:hypothetical protein